MKILTKSWKLQALERRWGKSTIAVTTSTRTRYWRYCTAATARWRRAGLQMSVRQVSATAHAPDPVAPLANLRPTPGPTTALALLGGSGSSTLAGRGAYGEAAV